MVRFAAISLQVIRGGNGESSVDVIVERILKGTCEARVTIRHHGLEESVEFNVREEERGKRRNTDKGGAMDELALW